MATFSAHQNCPECGEIDSIRYSPQNHFTMYWCDECGHEWEEDNLDPREYYHKAVGFGGLYSNQYKTRILYEKIYGLIPRGWELHHIDHNSDNNELINLIAIPSHVHNMIHDNPNSYGSKESILALLPLK